MEQVMVRSASPADLAVVEALLRESRLPTDGLVEAIDSFVVAEHDGRLVGVTGLEACGEYGLLRSVAVAPDWRGKGLGAVLVGRVIADASRRGLRALYLLTTTAAEFFPAFGFARIERVAVPDPVRRTVEFTSACPASATVMMRALP